MNAGIGTAFLPTIQIGLGLLQALKAFSLERSLGVADARFNFSFSIWILDPTGQGNRAIVRQDVAIERIQSGMIDVRDGHAYAQLAHVALDRLLAPVEGIFGYQVLPDCGGIPTAAQT